MNVDIKTNYIYMHITHYIAYLFPNLCRLLCTYIKLYIVIIIIMVLAITRYNMHTMCEFVGIFIVHI